MSHKTNLVPYTVAVIIAFFSGSLARADEVPAQVDSSTIPAAPAAVPAEAPVPVTATESPIRLAFGGQLFLALQNWSKAGMTDDSKMGVGVGGSIGIGLRVDDMQMTVGPSFWSNNWSADYSHKAQSATDRVFVAMADVGISVATYFDDMYLELGLGSSTMKSAMTASGKEIPYPYDGTSYSYKSVGVGFRSGSLLYGIGFKSYQGFASAANHLNLMLGLAI